MWDPNVTFRNPEFLYALAVLPAILYWYVRRHRRTTSEIRYSTLLPFAGVKPTFRERLRHLPFAVRVVAVGLLLVGLARPQKTSEGENVYTEGIDIVLLLDISGSMLAEDFQPNRIGAAKEVAQNFIDGRHRPDAPGAR
jgi:Ca-activated chloride channel family protein